MELFISGQITTVIDGDRLNSYFLIPIVRRFDLIANKLVFNVGGDKYECLLEDLVINGETVTDKTDCLAKLKDALKE